MYTIDSHINSLEEIHSEIVRKSEFELSIYVTLLNKAKEITPTIEDAFDKCGFKVERFHCIRTGMNGDGKQLKIGYHILPKSPTFRYIKFNGYDRSGAGKNQPKLVKKANDLTNKLLELTGLEPAVNHYCFEIDRGKDIGGSILVDFWVELEE